jgi:formiminotetrahydrofolate cyclodeaminase
MAAAAGQSVEVFKETWGIASPSKVARQLARYFMQGLNLGFGDVKINIGKFSKTILKAITDEMDELLPSAQEKIDETMKQLKIDPNMTDRDF